MPTIWCCTYILLGFVSLSVAHVGWLEIRAIETKGCRSIKKLKEEICRLQGATEKPAVLLMVSLINRNVESEKNVVDPRPAP